MGLLLIKKVVFKTFLKNRVSKRDTCWFLRPVNSFRREEKMATASLWTAKDGLTLVATKSNRLNDPLSSSDETKSLPCVWRRSAVAPGDDTKDIMVALGEWWTLYLTEGRVESSRYECWVSKIASHEQLIRPEFSSKSASSTPLLNLQDQKGLVLKNCSRE